MLTVHHLGKSQSERIVWLCEELGIPYELKRYERVAVTMLAPQMETVDFRMPDLSLPIDEPKRPAKPILDAEPAEQPVCRID